MASLRPWMIVFLLVLASGCVSTRMVDRADPTIRPPEPGTARIVFMRSSFVGSAIQSSVYDVTRGEPEFIGILSNGRKLSHLVEPGEHIFMVHSEAGDFLKATLAEGKTYHAIVTPRMGLVVARFSIKPVRNDAAGEFRHDSKRVGKWISRLPVAENTPASLEWFEKNRERVQRSYDRYWPAWQEKSESSRAAATLNETDGI